MLELHVLPGDACVACRCMCCLEMRLERIDRVWDEQMMEYRTTLSSLALGQFVSPPLPACKQSTHRHAHSLTHIASGCHATHFTDARGVKSVWVVAEIGWRARLRLPHAHMWWVMSLIST